MIGEQQEDDGGIARSPPPLPVVPPAPPPTHPRQQSQTRATPACTQGLPSPCTTRTKCVSQGCDTSHHPTTTIKPLPCSENTTNTLVHAASKASACLHRQSHWTTVANPNGLTAVHSPQGAPCIHFLRHQVSADFHLQSVWTKITQPKWACGFQADPQRVSSAAKHMPVYPWVVRCDSRPGRRRCERQSASSHVVPETNTTLHLWSPDTQMKQRTNPQFVG